MQNLDTTTDQLVGDSQTTNTLVGGLQATNQPRLVPTMGALGGPSRRQPANPASQPASHPSHPPQAATQPGKLAPISSEIGS